MKTLKILSVMSLGMLSLATAGIAMQSQPVQAGPEAVSCHEQSLCGKCGDGYCAKQCGETATSCPSDCGVAY
jgi:hypothetical protein